LFHLSFHIPSLGPLGKEGGSGGWSHLHFEIFGRQLSDKWGVIEGYAFLWEAYLLEQKPKLLAVARPHQLAATGEGWLRPNRSHLREGWPLPRARGADGLARLHGGRPLARPRWSRIARDSGGYPGRRGTALRKRETSVESWWIRRIRRIPLERYRLQAAGRNDLAQRVIWASRGGGLSA
jgi:hypothetical protein